MDKVGTANTIMLTLLLIKHITFGIEFDFISWFRYGKLYWNWYYGRESFADYKKRA